MNEDIQTMANRMNQALTEFVNKHFQTNADLYHPRVRVALPWGTHYKEYGLTATERQIMGKIMNNRSGQWIFHRDGNKWLLNVISRERAIRLVKDNPITPREIIQHIKQ